MLFACTNRKNASFGMVYHHNGGVSQPERAVDERRWTGIVTNPCGSLEVPKSVVRQDADPTRNASKSAHRSSARKVGVVHERIQRAAFTIGVARDERVPRESAWRAVGGMKKRDAIGAGVTQTSSDGERIGCERELTSNEHGRCC